MRWLGLGRDILPGLGGLFAGHCLAQTAVCELRRALVAAMDPWRMQTFQPSGGVPVQLAPMYNMSGAHTMVHASMVTQLPANPASSATEQQRLSRSSQIEAALGGVRLNTAYVGNIPDGVTDEVMEGLLYSCGPVARWRRVFDASNMPKSFGFCEFGSADAMGRALAILHDLPLLGGKRLIVKIDDATVAYLKRYTEALSEGEVAVSSREADVGAAETCMRILKERNFYSAVEAMERKIVRLSEEVPEEGEEVDVGGDARNETSKDRERGEEGGKKSARQESKRKESRSQRERQRERENEREREREREKKHSQERSQERRDSRVADGQAKAFKEREHRWQSREAQIQQKVKRWQQLDRERMEREREEREYASKYLSTFDDWAWMMSCLDRLVGIVREGGGGKVEGRIPDFYSNRELWRSRRSRDREREEEIDRRDEEMERARGEIEETERERESLASQKEQEQLQQQQTASKAGDISRQSSPSLSLTSAHANGEHASSSIGLGICISSEGALGGQGTGGVPVKRARPTATEVLDHATGPVQTAPPEDAGVKKRPALVAKDFSREELLATGLSAQEASSRFKQLYKEKVARLIERIPRDQEELFRWEVDWKYLNAAKMLVWIRKKTLEMLSNYKRSASEGERIAQSLMAQVQQQAAPETIVSWILEDGLLVDSKSSSSRKRTEEAQRFMAILWRYLVYETESTAYNLAPPE